MEMRTTTILIALTMLTTGLAGCTGDPDGGGNDEIDAETLQNLQDFINGTMVTEWINDRGDSGHQWTLSLSDDQWLEVSSIRVVLGDNSSGENDWSQPAYIMSDEGYYITDSSMRDGQSNSPIFGGNYSFCSGISSQTCFLHPYDDDRYMVEWSVIYRIHDVSATNYHYTGVLPPDPPLLENQNITLEVSYVPWNSTEGEDSRIYGTIVIELFPNEAPLHVDSFVTHIENGAYNNTNFHRVIDGFVIQGGNINGAGGYAGDWYGYCNGEPATSCDTADMTIPSESDNGLTHGPGALAMARSNDPDSGGSQFYIVPSDSMPSHLDGSYTVFGQVISGQEHVDAISEVDTGSSDVPIHDVILQSAWVN
jgi:peptidyl-prolyl cis-trans isomerase B (cyclophilin B)